MQQMVIAAGLALLILSAIITIWLRRRMTGRSQTANSCRKYVRLRFSRSTERLLLKTARIADTTGVGEALHASARKLMTQLLRIRSNVRALPPLPSDVDGSPRITPLAGEAADDGQFSPEHLIHLLTGWSEAPASPAEISSFPLCIAAAQCRRLTSVLQEISRCAKDCAAAKRLSTRLLRSKDPRRLLDRSHLGIYGAKELFSLLHAKNAPALTALLDQWLAARGTSAEELAMKTAARQMQLAEELRRAENCFSALDSVDWRIRSEEADEIHSLLLADPSGVYPKMDHSSRLALRRAVEELCRRTGLTPAEMISRASTLSLAAGEHSLEHYIGYWFQDAKGLCSLHRSLSVKRGWLYARLSLRQEALSYAGLWVFGVVTGFLFLHSGGPVFMLPFFALTAGTISRFLLRRPSQPRLPGMELPAVTDELRTLVILPAVLSDPHEAIRRVRQLKTARHAFPASGVDFLLLGDFPDNMTAVSSMDAPIIHAAASAIAALADDRCLYIQRGRTWNGSRHTCCARGGIRGAVRDICRLIAQGECEDVMVYTNVDISLLERKYAYVLVLPQDRQAVPGLLEALLRKMTHPLCMRYPGPEGWRGFSVLSPQGCDVFEGVGLIRPDAHLEATDGLVDAALDADALCGELAGHASVADARVQSAHAPDSAEEQYAHALRVWQLAPWQLPWVQTPSGLVRNPLMRASRFRLRERLRSTLVPLGQCALLLWAVLTNSYPLLLLALLAPMIGQLPRGTEELVRLLCRLCLLPSRAAVTVSAIISAIRRRPVSDDFFLPLTVWVQGIAAALLTALALALPYMTLPALMLGVLFACFPLAHRFSEIPLHSSEGLTEDHASLLSELCAGTWRFFCDQVTEETRFLPPVSVQFEPAAGAERVTSPEAIGAYLLSCVCARDLGYVSADEAAARISRAADALAELSMPFGLPCRRYSLPALTVADARVDASGTGLLLSALMTAAQALRTWLPEMSSQYDTLSAKLEKAAADFDLSRLYDEGAGLFHQQLDENGQGAGWIACFADEALLLSVSACARGLIPPEHFSRLSRACVRLQGKEIMLSRSGTAAEHLLAGLFLPADERRARAFIRAMSRRAHDGLWGQGDCGYFGFDPALRYQRAVFGMPEAALFPASAGQVYAPYAAALCLPFTPHQAGDALLRFHALGASGPHGMCDAVDCAQGAALVGLHDSYHQGLLMAAAAHMLADAPVQRYFCAIPEVEACLPLLEQDASLPVLPVFPVRRSGASSAADQTWETDPLSDPAECHLLGTGEFRITMDVRGNSALFEGAFPLTGHSTHAAEPQGIQFYLADEGRVYRVGDALLPGRTLFAPGEVRLERICGSLKAELVCVADTLHRRALHILTITNLSTRDRVIDAADVLLPDLGVPGNTLEPLRPEKDCLTLHARGTDRTLHHRMAAAAPLLSVIACTDADVFLGRGRTLHRPASLEEAPHDHLLPSVSPCLSFRAKLALGGRGQATLWFVTSLQDQDAPTLSELPGLRRLAALQHSAISAAVPLLEHLQHTAQRLAAPLLAASGRMHLTLADGSSLTVLTELVRIMDWLFLHGISAALTVHCPQPDKAKELLQGFLTADQVSFTEEAPAAASLLLDDQPLSVQIDALYARLPQPGLLPAKPIPAMLPAMELVHASTYGGFDPETGDHIIELEPGMTTPAPWINRHTCRRFSECVDESGFGAPFSERLWLQMAGGTLLSPWSQELPRCIRMSAGMTVWEAWSDKLDIRLCAACLPEQGCGLRVLRIRNATDEPLTLQLTLQAALTHTAAIPDCAPGIITAEDTVTGKTAFIAADGWAARRAERHPLLSEELPPLPSEPAEGQGSFAVLERQAELPPHGSGEFVWLAGYIRHAEEIVHAQNAVRASGASALLRSVKAAWTQRLDVLRVSTPEETLDLLMNRILPVQTFHAEGAAGVPALSYLAPAEARQSLMRWAQRIHTRDEWAELALLMNAYAGVTGDAGIPDVRLHRGGTLLEACTEELLRLPLDRNGLPMGQEQARQCLLYAGAAQALNDLRPDEALQEYARKLLNAADVHLWADGCYGLPLRLDVQCLAQSAYGSNPRTRQAMRSAWTALYDQLHGLIRRQEATDAPPLPGLPENGGMVTLDAVCCLHALLMTDHTDEAHELLRALNPIHHTDDAVRMETFRCAPYQLHGGMCASPMEAGRAVSAGGDQAAALLYTVILRDVLGLRREGSAIRMKPIVPAEWDDFSLTLREGAATWHISMERKLKQMTIDGEDADVDSFTLTDDGRVHQVRIPLK